ncbi:MAG: hypothetical protein LVR00_09595 [Rhabdochlamydiaceae bacterium]|jgi:hypothetical protein
MPEFEEDDYSDPAFMSRLFEAIIFRCLFAQGESRFLLKFLQKGTQDKLTELQDKTYPPNVIEALRKKSSLRKKFLQRKINS